MVTHLLRQLHNYLLYINMVKVSVVEKVNGVMEKNISIKSNLNQTKREHEKWKISENQFTKNIEQNEKVIDSTRAEINGILIQEKAYEEKSIEFNRIISERQEIFFNLNEEHTNLKSQLISDQESNHLLQSQLMLANEIAEYQEKETLLHQNISEYSEKIASTQSFIAKLSDLIAFKSTLDGSVKVEKAKFESARIAINHVEKEFSNISRSNEITKENVESLKACVQNSSLQYEKKLKSDRKQEIKMTRAVTNLREMAMEYEKNFQSQIATIDRMKVEIEIIKETGDQVEHFMNSMKKR